MQRGEMFNAEIDRLRDDGFEGSHDERNIFREVFFGNDSGGTSKRCFVTGVINFECDSSKNTDTSLCSNSASSAVTSSFCVESSNINDLYVGASALGCFPETFVSVDEHNQDERIKRMKFSTDNTSDTNHEGKTILEESHHENIDSGGLWPAGRETVTLHLVESFSHGVTSSCYLLKQHVHLAKAAEGGDRSNTKIQLQNLDGNDGKSSVGGKAIASPVSQESFAATGIVVTNPSKGLLETSACPLNAKDNPIGINSRGVHVPTVCSKIDPNCSKIDPKEDPRPFLLKHGVRLLTWAGWSIEKRGRPNRKHIDTIYIPPAGRTFREFTKAWKLCGQTLLADRYNLVEEDNDKKWSDISHFWSDLSSTILHIQKVLNESDPSNKLAIVWSLLDPFVTLVFMDKKIGLLRKGCEVKATRSLVIEKYKKDGNEISLDSGLTVIEGSHKASNANFGCESFSKIDGHEIDEIKNLCGFSITTSAKEDTFMVDADEIENQFSQVSNDRISKVDMNSFPACESDRAYVLSGMYPSHISHNVLKMTKVASPKPDTNASPTCNKSDFEYNVEMPKLVTKDIVKNSLEIIECPEINTMVNNTCLHREEQTSPGLTQNGGLGEVEGLEFLETSTFAMDDKHSARDLSRKKSQRKCKKISEIKLSTLYQNEDLDSSSPSRRTEWIDADGIQSESNDICQSMMLSLGGKGSHSKLPVVSSLQHKIEKKSLNGSGRKKVKASECDIEDDELLVSAIIRNKKCSRSCSRPNSKSRGSKLRAKTKKRSQRGGCRLLPRNGKKGKHKTDNRWSLVGPRTVLSWLLSAEVIFLNDVIQYRDGALMKDGVITRDGIMCKCCRMVLSLSEFRSHAGFTRSSPCMDLYMESGKSLTLCQLEAWSVEYSAKKIAMQATIGDKDDPNDDSCGLCGDGGELICCDKCPSTYHQACLSMQDLPEGSWYCSNCTCWLCGELVNTETSDSLGAFKCSQCEHKYHEVCLERKGKCKGVVPDAWFCGESCEEVYSGLTSCVGVMNDIGGNFSWTLLKCVGEEQNLSPQHLAEKANYNSKLAVSLSIMEECFQSMVDPRTGINMIPQVLYSWESAFARLNFQGFYTVVLEKADVVISVASIRVHGVTIAEMPLIATCSNYRRQGMCRRLMNAIEKVLISCKVEKLIVAAIPELVATWTDGFGFELVQDKEKEILKKINLMVFPGTILLKKPLYEPHRPDLKSNDMLQTGKKDSTASGDCFSSQMGEDGGAEKNDNNGSPPVFPVPLQMATTITELDTCFEQEPSHENSELSECRQTSSLQERFSKMSCEHEPSSSQREGIVANVQSLCTYDEIQLSLDKQPQEVL